MPGSVVASVAAPIVGGLIGGDSASDAAQTQANAANEAARIQKEMYDQTREDLEPLRQTGLRAKEKLSHLMGLGEFNRDAITAGLQKDHAGFFGYDSGRTDNGSLSGGPADPSQPSKPGEIADVEARMLARQVLSQAANPDNYKSGHKIGTNPIFGPTISQDMGSAYQAGYMSEDDLTNVGKYIQAIQATPHGTEHGLDEGIKKGLMDAQNNWYYRSAQRKGLI